MQGIYSRRQYLLLVLFTAVVGLVVPLAVHSRTGMNLVDLWLVYSVAGIGFYWVFGLTGRFAFCQTFMMALGGYMTAWAARHGLPFVICLAAAMVLTGTVAAIVGAALWRTEEFYFAIGTMAITEIGVFVFGRSSGFSGQNGNVTGIPYPSVLGRELRTDSEVFWLFLAVLALAVLLTIFLLRSPIGRELAALRARPLVARTAGIPVYRLQLLMFVFGSAVGGLSGALLAHWHGFTSVEAFGIDLAIGLFLMVILGGRRSVWGVVLGAAFYVGVPEALSDLDRYTPFVYGGVLLAVIMLLPDGLVGAARKGVAVLRHPGETWPHRKAAPSVPTPSEPGSG